MEKDTVMSAAFENSIALTTIGVVIQAFSAGSGSIAAENPPMSRRWSDCENELRSIGEYRKDWDGMGAEAPRKESIDAAIQMLAMFRENRRQFPPSAIGATPTGSVMMEWRFGDDYLEAEFVDFMKVEWLEVKGNSIREWSDLLSGSDRAPLLGVEGRAWQSNIKSSGAVLEPAFAKREWALDVCGKELQ
jgi:hypothetical protein